MTHFARECYQDDDSNAKNLNNSLLEAVPMVRIGDITHGMQPGFDRSLGVLALNRKETSTYKH